jgi:hypothetical protein
VPILAWNSPGTKILHNTILTNGTSTNAIEYRFANTKGVVIANNICDAPILARNGAEAETYGNVTLTDLSAFVSPAGGDLRLRRPLKGVSGAAEKLRPPLTHADCSDDLSGRPRDATAPGDVGAALKQ